jgi:hypothetical protein
VGQLRLSRFPLNVSDTEAPHSFLSRLKEEGRIPSLSFGYQVGAVYRKCMYFLDAEGNDNAQ